MNTSRQTSIFRTLLLIVCSNAVPLAAQQYYQASIGGATYYEYATGNISRGTRSYYAVNIIGYWSPNNLTLRPDLPLKMKDGKWIAAAVSEYGVSSLGEGLSLYTSVLNSQGTVVTYESGSFTEEGIIYNSIVSTETLDLNSGEYSFYDVIFVTYTGYGAGNVLLTADITAALPVSLSPTIAPSLVGYAVNPYEPYLQQLQLPSYVDGHSVPGAPPAAGLSADGISAVAMVVQSNSDDPVSLQLTAPGFAGSGSVGGLTPYNSAFLSSPQSSSATDLTLYAPNYCDSDGSNRTCTFLALVWAPNTMPLGQGDLQNGTFYNVPLAINAQQGVLPPITLPIILEPPPVVLVHGIWSSAEDAWPSADPAAQSFFNWLLQNYPHQYITRVDYKNFNSLGFDNPSVQYTLLDALLSALQSGNQRGIASRNVDVVAHSMGGLVTRSFINQNVSGFLPANPVHTLITIGTPQVGTPVATALVSNENNNTGDLLAEGICQVLFINPCSLSKIFMYIGKPIGAGVISLENGIQDQQNTYSSMIGLKPSQSTTETTLNWLVNAFIPGQTIDSILQTDSNDTIVSQTSQTSGASDSSSISGVVHTSVCPTIFGIQTCSDVGETRSSSIFSQALYWLMGGTGQYNPMQLQRGQRSSGEHVHQRHSGIHSDDSPGLPNLNLTGYTQVDPSNVSFTPPSNSALPANTTAAITATSSTKQISEILLFQNVTDPTDMLLNYATQSPFSVSFTPTRLGPTQFAAFAVFTDMTYAVVSLQYVLQAPGTPLGLQLMDAPTGTLPIGVSTQIQVEGGFSNGLVDVTSAATYSQQSGGSGVFSIGQNGLITTTGNGVDWLSVSYNGVSTSTQISVGGCAYLLAPTNQVVDAGGGSVNVSVTTADGCSWTASGGATWLTFNNASGTGNGTITLTAAANNTGASQTAFVTLPGQDVAVTQPATSNCTYTVNPMQINLPSSGGNGVIQVSSSCPIVTSSDSIWLTAVVVNSGVSYAAILNPTQSQRQGNITIGNVVVPVMQAAGGQTFTLTLASLPVVAGNVIATPPPVDGVYASGTQVCLTAVPNAGWNFSSWTGDPLGTNGCLTMTANMSETANFVPPQALQFVTVTPCRVVDTRNPKGPFGGPPISGGTERDFPLPNGSCGIPSNAAAYSLNVTVVPQGRLGYLTVWPTGENQPVVSTMNSDGRTKANAAIVPTGTNGAVSVYASNTTNVILDIDGYFVPVGNSTLTFYPVTPCRVFDTRNPKGPLGGPYLQGGQGRDFPVLASSCGIPATAQAYSMNFTAVPRGRLGYLTVWPTGQQQPLVSTLNAHTGTTTANAAIVPSGNNGEINVYPSNDTDLLGDINGYFAPPGQGGLSLYSVVPCRALDTRQGNGPFSGTLPVNIVGVPCGVPNTAQAFVLNATVVPQGPLGYLTLWPDGQQQPLVSTLNAPDGATTSNMAIVPTTDGIIDAFASSSTHLIIDSFSYFAP